MSDVDAVTTAIDRDLEEIARGVVARHLDLSVPENTRFHDQPDDRAQHQAKWHQWGILTHTRRFLKLYDGQVQYYLREWRLQREVDAVLVRPIDGVPRRDLLRIGILLHDIGKFGKRSIGRTGFHFAGHEKLSGEIIRDEIDLERYGLTPDQAEYVARTAEDHFVLGLVRRRARENGRYDAKFVSSPEFYRLACAIRSAHPDDFVEIGVLFLGDSLAKANPGEGPEPALSQYDLNIEVAHSYLEIALGDGSG